MVCCLVLFHAELFGHMLELSICGVHSMKFLGQDVGKFEGFGDVSWNGNFDIFLVVIPVNGQSTVVLPFKVDGYFVIFSRVFKGLSASVSKKCLTPKFSTQTQFFFFACHKRTVEYLQGI